MRVACPKCKVTLKIAAKIPAKIKCSKCGHSFVPKQASVDDRPEEIDDSVDEREAGESKNTKAATKKLAAKKVSANPPKSSSADHSDNQEEEDRPKKKKSKSNANATKSGSLLIPLVAG